MLSFLVFLIKVVEIVPLGYANYTVEVGEGETYVYDGEPGSVTIVNRYTQPNDPPPPPPPPVVNPQGTVIVNFVDTEGNSLSPSFSFTGDVGTNYGTSARDITDWFLFVTPDNASGTFIEGTIVVTYVYNQPGDPVEPDEPEILLEAEEIPLAPALVPPEEVLMLEEEIPLGDALPVTGHLPSVGYVGLGSIISMLGWAFRKRK